MIALRILAGLARAIPRQIVNKELRVGCNRRPLEKITAFKFCLFSAARKGNEAYTNKETDRFGVVRTISKITLGSNQSIEFVTVTSL